MKQIKLSGKNGEGKIVLVDDKDYEYLNQFKWFALVASNKIDYYAARSKCIIIDNKKKYPHWLMHRDIMKVDDPYTLIDHINHNTLDNQRS